MSRFRKRGQRITVKPREQRTYNGVLYASKAEAIRAQELDLLIRSGDVVFWIGQPLFRLGCEENTYRLDFLVVGFAGGIADGIADQDEPYAFSCPWVEDVKGFETQSFKRHKRLWKAYGPCELRVLKRKGSGWTTEIVSPAEADAQGGEHDDKEGHPL